MSIAQNLQSVIRKYRPDRTLPGGDLEYGNDEGANEKKTECIQTNIMTHAKWTQPGQLENNLECLPTPGQYCMMALCVSTQCDAWGMGGMCFRHREEFTRCSARNGPLTVDVTYTQMAKKPNPLWMLYSFMDPINSYEYYMDLLKKSTNLNQPVATKFATFLEFLHSNIGSLHKTNGYINLIFNAQRKFVHRYASYLPKCYLDVYCRKDYVPLFLARFAVSNPTSVNIHQFDNLDNSFKATLLSQMETVRNNAAGGAADPTQLDEDPTKNMYMISIPMTALLLPDIIFLMSFATHIHENAIAPNTIVLRHDLLIGVGYGINYPDVDRSEQTVLKLHPRNDPARSQISRYTDNVDVVVVPIRATTAYKTPIHLVQIHPVYPLDSEIRKDVMYELSSINPDVFSTSGISAAGRRRG